MAMATAAAVADTSVAAGAALGHRRPVGEHAVDRARLRVADRVHAEVRAGVAAVLGVGDDGARAGLGAAIAGLGAGAISAPCGDLAVDGI